MSKSDTLNLLSQVKEVELCRLRQQLAHAETRLQVEQARLEEQRLAVLACTAEYEAAKATGGQVSGAVAPSAFQYQMHRGHLVELNRALQRTRVEFDRVGAAAESAQAAVFELKSAVRQLLGQQAGLTELQARQSRLSALKSERALDDALNEQWTAKAR
jgi:hypothetical protein